MGSSYGDTISHISVQGSITSSADDTGGLIGVSSADSSSLGTNVSNSSFNGTVSGDDDYTGGLAGYGSQLNIKNSYANSTVSGTYYTGGLLGNESGSSGTAIQNSYAAGQVTGCSYAGGLVGRDSTTAITNSFSASKVSETSGCGSPSLGGLVGRDTSSSGLWSNNFFDKGLSTQSNCVNTSDSSNTCTPEDSDGHSASYFYNQNNAPLNSWDFTNTWQAQASGYPLLIAEAVTTGSTSTGSGSAATSAHTGKTTNSVVGHPSANGSSPIDLDLFDNYKNGQGQQFAVALNQVFNFSINVNGTTEQHVLTVADINTNGPSGPQVTFTLHSTPQTFSVGQGQTVKRQIDPDNKAAGSIGITVNSITASQVALSRLAYR
ncbi:MAG: hypothetical protein WDN66_04895 [Candidatus Saccharibacteria bacterium]